MPITVYAAGQDIHIHRRRSIQARHLRPSMRPFPLNAGRSTVVKTSSVPHLIAKYGSFLLVVLACCDRSRKCDRIDQLERVRQSATSTSFIRTKAMIRRSSVPSAVTITLHVHPFGLSFCGGRGQPTTAIVSISIPHAGGFNSRLT